MTKEEIKNLQSMLTSENINDVNLAGSIIKNQVLKITDEQMELLDTIFTGTSKDGYLIDRVNLFNLLNSNVQKGDRLFESWKMAFLDFGKGEIETQSYKNYNSGIEVTVVK